MKLRIILPLFTFLLFCIGVITLVNSCMHESIGISTLDSVYFDKQIFPIIQNNCTASGCHNESSEEFPLTSYDEILKQLNPGSSINSKLYKAITASYSNPMPPDKPLTVMQRSLIKIWIDQGAKNNKAPTSDTSQTDTTKVVEKYKACFSRDILPVLTSNCATSNCHNVSSARDGIVLSDYSNTMKIVNAGNTQESELYQIIIRTDNERMPPPPRSALSKANIDSIAAWITYGALNETCPEICDSSNYSFAAAINPIITNNCISCHNENYKSGDISLSNYTNIATIAQNGKLVGTINKSSGYPLMPPSNKMNNCNIVKIQKWVKSGYPNN